MCHDCDCEEEDDSVSLLEGVVSALTKECKRHLPKNPWEEMYKQIYTPESINRRVGVFRNKIVKAASGQGAA